MDTTFTIVGIIDEIKRLNKKFYDSYDDAGVCDRPFKFVTDGNRLEVTYNDIVLFGEFVESMEGMEFSEIKKEIQTTMAAIKQDCELFFKDET